MYTQEHVGSKVSAHSVRMYREGNLLLGLLLLAACACAAAPGEFVATEVHHSDVSGVQLLDAQFSIRLSTGAREALDNGVPLTLELQVQLVREHVWMWDSVEVEHVLVRQLQYYALSRSYQLRDIKGNTLANYNRLDDALAAAGSIDRMLLTSLPLEEGRHYMVRLRGSIDIEALPTPVRLLAYVSSDWDMNSEWYSWPLER